MKWKLKWNDFSYFFICFLFLLLFYVVCWMIVHLISFYGQLVRPLMSFDVLWGALISFDVLWWCLFWIQIVCPWWLIHLRWVSQLSYIRLKVLDEFGSVRFGWTLSTFELVLCLIFKKFNNIQRWWLVVSGWNIDAGNVWTSAKYPPFPIRSLFIFIFILFLLLFSFSLFSILWSRNQKH